MATAEAASRHHDRHSRKRPFTGWMKRLANLKSSTNESPNASTKKAHTIAPPKSKKHNARNNPYPESGHFNDRDGPNSSGQVSLASPNAHPSRESFLSGETSSISEQPRAPAKSTKSMAPTVATIAGTIQSGQSKADTGRSTNVGGGGSTFSSPNYSEQSLTTTLTTIQSTAPSHALNGLNGNAQAVQATTPVVFSHQFPVTSPASAIPAHLAPQSPPQTYQAATANNILSDNASILTLASSSKRRRRNSLDTNASVRALAPSSLWGGSRESLPLSVLSAAADSIYSPQSRPGVGGFANTERASVYSSSGVAAPVLSSERNSYYANKHNADGMSVRSGLLGHGRNDSISGSIGPNPASPLASPRELMTPGKLRRRSSDWQPTGEDIPSGEDGDVLASPVAVDHTDHGKGRV